MLRDIGLQSFHIALHYCCIQRRIMTVAKRNRVTLADVAKAANVSRSTASRALNNSPRISRETTARIKKIADSMGFIPNAQGRALAVGRNETIAILITEPLDELFDDPTYAMFISGITEKLQRIVISTGIIAGIHRFRTSSRATTSGTTLIRRGYRHFPLRQQLFAGGNVQTAYPLRNAWPDGGSLI